MIHNAFGKGLEHYGKDIDQLCLDLHSLFKYSAARREDFKEVQVEMELDTNNFLQHTEVRWLSIGPSIKRILEQWDAITHFVAELAKDSKKVPKCLIGISHSSEWAFQSSQPSFRVASIPESSHIFCLQYYFISQS